MHELRRFITETLATLKPSVGDVATPENAFLVRELKHRLAAEGYYELSLALPIEAEKYCVSAYAQFHRCLEALDAPKAVEQGDTLTPRAVAKLLKKSPDAVLAWIKSGELRASNLGNGRKPRWTVTKDDLNEFLKSKQPPKPEPPKKRIKAPQIPGGYNRYSR